MSRVQYSFTFTNAQQGIEEYNGTRYSWSTLPTHIEAGDTLVVNTDSSGVTGTVPAAQGWLYIARLA